MGFPSKVFHLKVDKVSIYEEQTRHNKGFKLSRHKTILYFILKLLSLTENSFNCSVVQFHRLSVFIRNRNRPMQIVGIYNVCLQLTVGTH